MVEPEPRAEAEVSTGGGRASVWTGLGETGVAGPFESSVDEGGECGVGDAGGTADMVMAIRRVKV